MESAADPQWQQQTYHLRLEPASSAVWAPNYFTTFESPDQIKEKLIRKENIQEGVGGALVGVRIVNPPDKFMPAKGITAPVTATLDFHATDATSHFAVPPSNRWRALKEKPVLWRPIFQHRSATTNRRAICLLVGVMGGHYDPLITQKKTGLYFLQPYEPDRIPVVFVHGLISTPFDWAQDD